MENIEDPSEQQLARTRFKLFGINFVQTQCQKDAILYGVPGGIGCGLLSFLFTSRGRKSSYIGFAAFCAINLVYGGVCLYNDYLISKKLKSVKRALHNYGNVAITKTGEETPDMVIKNA